MDAESRVQSLKVAACKHFKPQTKTATKNNKAKNKDNLTMIFLTRKALLFHWEILHLVEK